MVKAIIFDVDGTLLDTERIYMRAWLEAGALFGYMIPDEALLKTRAVNAKTAAACFKEFCGSEFPYETIRKERERISERIIEETPGQGLLMPDAQETLKWLKEQGYMLAAASSTCYEKTVSHLEHAGLLQYFAVLVGGDMVMYGKPEPDVFLKAAALLQVKPEECLVVGDTPADVLGGTSAGIPVVLIPDQVPANAKTTALSIQILNGLSDLPDTVKKVDLCSRS